MRIKIFFKSKLFIGIIIIPIAIILTNIQHPILSGCFYSGGFICYFTPMVWLFEPVGGFIFLLGEEAFSLFFPLLKIFSFILTYLIIYTVYWSIKRVWMMKNIRLKIIILISIGILVVGGGTTYIVNKKTPREDIEPVCTKNLKKCSDGSFVSRIAPDCEFAECLDINTGNRTENPITSTDSNADWKIYQNEEYGFEFRYPEKFFINTQYPKGIELNILSSNNPKKKSSVGLTYSFVVLIEKVKDLKQVISEMELYENFTKEKIFLESGLEGIQTTYEGAYAGERHFVTFFEKKNSFYQISFSENSVFDFNQILSTFKFID